MSPLTQAWNSPERGQRGQTLKEPETRNQGQTSRAVELQGPGTSGRAKCWPKVEKCVSSKAIVSLHTGDT